jgi:hypothetical protein
MNIASADLSRFYEVLARLERLPNQGLPLRQLASKHSLPNRGVYFFREPGEMFEPSGAARIVRVGTHAVSAGSKSTLHSRLKAHKGSQSGSGNHRGSIFRLHVGHALLVKENHQILTWGSGSTAPQGLRANPAAQLEEALWEKRVSDIIGAMTVLWVDIPDEPSSESQRATIERNSIALLSNRLCPVAAANDQWLGRFNPREAIRASRLWNLKHIDESHDRAFLDLLEQAVDRTCFSFSADPNLRVESKAPSSTQA